jgi:hypothetical protein
LSGQASPQIAIDAAGNGLAVWQQLDGWHYRIGSNRYTAGAEWGTATLIENSISFNSVEPQVAFDATGNALAVWHQYDTTQYSIWWSRYTAAGGWTKAAQLHLAGTGEAVLRQIAIDPNGNALAVWVQGEELTLDVWSGRFE